MKKVRIYDLKTNGDRYTAVDPNPLYYGANREKYFVYLRLSAAPFHPQGICQHGETRDVPIDRPNGRHLGIRVKLESLNVDVQSVIKTFIKENGHE